MLTYLCNDLKDLLAGKDILAPTRKRKFVKWGESNLVAGKVPQKIVEITQATGKMSVKSADIIVCYGKRVFEMPELSKVADLKI